MRIQTVKGTFDSAHRLLGVTSKCTNVHGHTYSYAVKFAFNHTAPEGYPVDFSVLKQHVKGWIDEHLDHAYIANCEDSMIGVCLENEFKLFIMSFQPIEDSHVITEGINPTVENIAKVIAVNIRRVLNKEDALSSAKYFYGLDLLEVELYETPNFGTVYQV